MKASLLKYGPWILALLSLLAYVITGVSPSVIKVAVAVPYESIKYENIYDTVRIAGRARVQLVHRLDADQIITNAGGTESRVSDTSLTRFNDAGASGDYTLADIDTTITLHLGDSSWIRIAVQAVYCIETQLYELTASVVDWKFYAICPATSETWAWIERSIAAALVIVSTLIK